MAHQVLTHVNPASEHQKRVRIFVPGFGQSHTWLKSIFEEAIKLGSNVGTTILIIGTAIPENKDKLAILDVNAAQAKNNENAEAPKASSDPTVPYEPFLSEIFKAESQLIDLNSYDEVEVVAWSYGVRVAPFIIEKALAAVDHEIKLVSWTNYAGTFEAVDLSYGISKKLHNLTLSSLTMDSLKDFFKSVVKPKPAKRMVKGIDEIIDIKSIVDTFSVDESYDANSTKEQDDYINSADLTLEEYKCQLALMPKYPLPESAIEDTAEHKTFIVNLYDAIMPYEAQLRSALKRLSCVEAFTFKEGKAYLEEKASGAVSKGEIIINPKPHLCVKDLISLIAKGSLS